MKTGIEKTNCIRNFVLWRPLGAILFNAPCLKRSRDRIVALFTVEVSVLFGVDVHGVIPEAVDELLGLDLAHADAMNGSEEWKLRKDTLIEHEKHLLIFFIIELD